MLKEAVLKPRSDDLCAKIRYKRAKTFHNIHKYYEKFLRVCSEFIAAKHPDHGFKTASINFLSTETFMCAKLEQGI